MEDIEVKRDRLRAVIREYLPHPTGKDGSGVLPDDRCHRYALIILYEDHRRDERFGRSHDVKNLEDLQRTLNNAISVAKRMSSSTQFNLDGWLNTSGNQDSPATSRQTTFLAEVTSLLEIVSDFRTEVQWAKQKASNKANDHAAAVAAACRRVWGEEALRQDKNWKDCRPFLEISPHQFDDDQGYSEAEAKRRQAFRDAIDARAPKQLSYDAPSDPGKFVRAVFSALDIDGRNGEVANPASALDRLRTATRENTSK